MGFSRQECWSGLPFPSPVDHVLSELSTMTHPFWIEPRDAGKHTTMHRAALTPKNYPNKDVSLCQSWKILPLVSPVQENSHFWYVFSDPSSPKLKFCTNSFFHVFIHYARACAHTHTHTHTYIYIYIYWAPISICQNPCRCQTKMASRNGLHPCPKRRYHFAGKGQHRECVPTISYCSTDAALGTLWTYLALTTVLWKRYHHHFCFISRIMEACIERLNDWYKVTQIKDGSRIQIQDIKLKGPSVLFLNP